ncbi:PepSY domain-containing protein [Curtobacterium sp. L1-20]|uniref:PepSY domain-containing protein n=1 Tax=Curtobacterium sp. L1-20 TaxID=3138181 RepID=UPI003B51A47F
MNARSNHPARPTSRTARRVAGLAALPLVASLALVGCSADDSDTASTGNGSGSGAASGAATTGGASGSSADTGSNDALLAAAATARKAVDASTVVSVEREQDGSAHEVLVVTADGAEHEVRTNAEGSAVDGSPRTDRTDADDTAENTRFIDAADLDVSDAVAAFEDLHAGTITELGLDDHLGKVVWEGDVRDASGTKHSVRIDAGSGDVVTDEVDSDD